MNSQLSQTFTFELSPLCLTTTATATATGSTWTSKSLAHRSSIIQNKARLHEQSQCVAALQQGLSLHHWRTSRRLANHSHRGQYKQRSPTPRPHSDSVERDQETVRWAPRGFIANLHLHLHHRSWSSWVSGGVAVLVVICVVVFG